MRPASRALLVSDPEREARILALMAPNPKCASRNASPFSDSATISWTVEVKEPETTRSAEELRDIRFSFREKEGRRLVAA